MFYSSDAKSTNEEGRNEQGELDIVRFSWDRSGAASTPGTMSQTTIPKFKLS